MPIYEYQCEECDCCFERLTILLEKDDYNCGEYFSHRVCLSG